MGKGVWVIVFLSPSFSPTTPDFVSFLLASFQKLLSFPVSLLLCLQPVYSESVSLWLSGSQLAPGYLLQRWQAATEAFRVKLSEILCMVENLQESRSFLRIWQVPRILSLARNVWSWPLVGSLTSAPPRTVLPLLGQPHAPQTNSHCSLSSQVTLRPWCCSNSACTLLSWRPLKNSCTPKLKGSDSEALKPDHSVQLESMGSSWR